MDLGRVKWVELGKMVVLELYTRLPYPLSLLTDILQTFHVKHLHTKTEKCPQL